MATKKKELTKSQKEQRRKENQLMITGVLSGVALGVCYALAAPFAFIADYTRNTAPTFALLSWIIAAALFVPTLVNYMATMLVVIVGNFRDTKRYLK